MSCDICNGLPNCPCCGDDNSDTRPCPDCDGTGIETYYNTNGDEITKEQHDALPPKERECDPCTTCAGTGVIIYEFEYDYE